MTDLPGPPDVDESSYGAKLWPTASPSTERGAPERRPSSGARGGRRPLRGARLLVFLAFGVFAFAVGFGVADSQTRGATDTRGTAPRTYEDGLQTGGAEGYERGFDKGRTKGFKQGYRNGHAEGKMAGRKAGFDAGYAKGKGVGHRIGAVDGCKAVFDELDTNRVIDHVPGANEKYWYLTRDQCKWASTMGN